MLIGIPDVPGEGCVADLHVHSKYSRRPSQWILQKIGCPESFTEPLRLYDIARERGMNLVTITDHNTIDGALEIAHLPHTFISEEITTYFPDDGCKLHVLAWDITEEQHREITRLRPNVFELAPYLRSQGIAHALAHPLFAVNDRLTIAHFEQSLLLFDTLECNGSRDDIQNLSLKTICDALTRRDLERMADRHDLAPLGTRPWEKTLVGGSDDHSSLNIARMHTRWDGPATTAGLLAALSTGECTPAGKAATPRTMAHNLYGIAYQFYRQRTNPGSAASEHICLRFADNMLTNAPKEEPGFVERFMKLIGRGKAALHTSFGESGPGVRDVLLREAAQLIFADEEFMRLARGGEATMDRREDEVSRFVSTASNRVLAQFLDRILTSVQGADLFDIFHSIGSASSLYALLAPYYVAYDLFSSEREFCKKCEEHFLVSSAGEPKRLKVAHFTDTLDETNGVARTIRQQLGMVGRHGKDMTVITCGISKTIPGVANFDPIGTFRFPEYPEIAVTYPPFMQMLAYCFEQKFDCILAATPGPVGLAAMLIARILRVPFHGTYHTAFPQYVRAFTEDTALEDGCWRFMTWFYGQMQRIYAPSEAVKRELAEHGIDPEKITTYPRGVDTDRFHPAKRNGFYGKYKIAHTTKLLYVGRISQEKGLDVLADAFSVLSRMRPDVSLILVGEGPYLDTLKRKLRGLPATFTGALYGEELAQAYASADLFVFPSATDTFGNVVLEALASGLPAIVTDQGGPCENVVANENGLVIPANDSAALLRAIVHIIDAPERMASMRRRARSYMEDRAFDTMFLKTWEMYGNGILRETP